LGLGVWCSAVCFSGPACFFFFFYVIIRGLSPRDIIEAGIISFIGALLMMGVTCCWLGFRVIDVITMFK